MKKKLIGVLLGFSVISFLLISSCIKDEGKQPVVVTQPVGCDTVTFSKHIKPIVEANCAVPGCHDGSNGNPLLATYEQFKDRADAGRIQARVLDAQGAQKMPPPPMELSADQKALLTCWLSNGKKQ